MSYRTRLAGTSDLSSVQKFYESMDSDFTPRISSRSGLDDYLKRALNQGEIGVCESNGNIVAALTYWRWKGELFLGTVGVSEEYRKTPVLYRLCQFLVKNEESQLPTLKLWTAPSEDAVKKLLPRFNFEKTKDITYKADKNYVLEEFVTDMANVRKYFKL